jgi:hypothetical protein
MKISQIAAAAALAVSALSASAADFLIDFNLLPSILGPSPAPTGSWNDLAIPNGFGAVAGLFDVSYTSAAFFPSNYETLATGGGGPGAAAYTFNNGSPGFLTITVTPLTAASFTLNSFSIGQYVGGG